MFKSIASALVIFAFGCSSRDDSTAEFRQALAMLNAEVDLHASECARGASASAMAAEMQRHEGRMDDLFNEMQSGFSSMMSHCTGNDVTAIHDVMSTLQSDEATHRTQMDATETLEASRTECSNYAGSARQRLGRMNDIMNGSGMHCMM